MFKQYCIFHSKTDYFTIICIVIISFVLYTLFYSISRSKLLAFASSFNMQVIWFWILWPKMYLFITFNNHSWLPVWNYLLNGERKSSSSFCGLLLPLQRALLASQHLALEITARRYEAYALPFISVIAHKWVMFTLAAVALIHALDWL